MKLTNNQYKILGHLMREPCTGYDIKKLLMKVASIYGSESNSQIYPSLNKLEKAKLVAMTLDQGEGRRPKKVYSITDAGREAFLAWLNTIEEPQPYRDAMMMKISLAEYMDPDCLKEQLTLFAAKSNERLQLIQELSDAMALQRGKRSDCDYILMTLDHFISLHKAQLAWANKYLQ